MKKKPRTGASRMRGGMIEKQTHPATTGRQPQTRRTIGGRLDLAALRALRVRP